MFPEVKKDALKRLSYIEGHLSGIRKMLGEDKYCVYVLKQTYAVRRAIEQLPRRFRQGPLQSSRVGGTTAGGAPGAESCPATTPWGSRAGATGPGGWSSASRWSGSRR